MAAAKHLRMSLAVAVALVIGIGLGAAAVTPQSGWRQTSMPAQALPHDAWLTPPLAARG